MEKKETGRERREKGVREGGREEGGREKKESAGRGVWRVGKEEERGGREEEEEEIDELCSSHFYMYN